MGDPNYKILNLNMRKKTYDYIIYMLSYLYIFVCYSFIIYYISYTIRITNKPEGWVYMIAAALMYFIVYSIINHLIISKAISHKMLIIIEALLFVSMLTLIISDFKYEEYLHLKYIQSTMPIKVTPGPGY